MAQQNPGVLFSAYEHNVYLTLTIARTLPVTKLRDPTSERASERVSQGVSERALSRRTCENPFCAGEGRCQAVLLLVGRYEGAVKNACTSFAKPGRKKKGDPSSRGEKGYRDKAQKRCPGKTGGRKSWPLIGKSKFVLRKLSDAASEQERRPMPLDYHKSASAMIAETIGTKRKLRRLLPLRECFSKKDRFSVGFVRFLKEERKRKGRKKRRKKR